MTLVGDAIAKLEFKPVGSSVLNGSLSSGVVAPNPRRRHLCAGVLGTAGEQSGKCLRCMPRSPPFTSAIAAASAPPLRPRSVLLGRGLFLRTRSRRKSSSELASTLPRRRSAARRSSSGVGDLRGHKDEEEHRGSRCDDQQHDQGVTERVHAALTHWWRMSSLAYGRELAEQIGAGKDYNPDAAMRQARAKAAQPNRRGNPSLAT